VPRVLWHVTHLVLKVTDTQHASQSVTRLRRPCLPTRLRVANWPCHSPCYLAEGYLAHAVGYSAQVAMPPTCPAQGDRRCHGMLPGMYHGRLPGRGYPAQVTVGYPAQATGRANLPNPTQPSHAMLAHHVTRQRLPGTYHSRLPGSSDRSCLPAMPCHAMPGHITPRYLPGTCHGRLPGSSDRSCHAMPRHITPRYPEEVTRHLSRSVTRLKRPVVPAMPCWHTTLPGRGYPALVAVGYPAQDTGHANRSA